MKAYTLLASSLLLVVAGLVWSREDAWLAVLPAGFALVGALIAVRRPQNPIGWLYLACGLVNAIVFATAAYTRSARPGQDVAASLSAHIRHPGFGLVIVSLLLFPNWRLLSPRWRWAVVAVIANAVVMLVSGIFEADYVTTALDLQAHPPVHLAAADVVFGIGQGITLALLVLAGVCLLLRLHRARGEERQQVKWFVYTVALVLFAFPVIAQPGGSRAVLLLPLIPLATALAILRHHLYDIDVVIKRTLVYGALTATLGGAYLASVLLLQLLLSPSSDLAIAGSTLAVAALFRPARTRIQQLVNRRFYRSAYDAQLTAEAFGARLRDEVSLEALADELRAVVTTTLRPAHVSVWLRR